MFTDSLTFRSRFSPAGAKRSEEVALIKTNELHVLSEWQLQLLISLNLFHSSTLHSIKLVKLSAQCMHKPLFLVIVLDLPFLTMVRLYTVDIKG